MRKCSTAIIFGTLTLHKWHRARSWDLQRGLSYGSWLLINFTHEGSQTDVYNVPHTRQNKTTPQKWRQSNKMLRGFRHGAPSLCGGLCLCSPSILATFWVGTISHDSSWPCDSLPSVISSIMGSLQTLPFSSSKSFQTPGEFTELLRTTIRSSY